MLVKDLKGIVSSKVYLGRDGDEDYESIIQGTFTIDEIIEKGYGEHKIKDIFHHEDCLYIIVY